jgi:hypothetical protein
MQTPVGNVCSRYTEHGWGETAFAEHQPALACTPALVALQVNRNRLWEVVAEVTNVLLRKCLSCDDCFIKSACTTASFACT